MEGAEADTQQLASGSREGRFWRPNTPRVSLFLRMKESTSEIVLNLLRCSSESGRLEHLSSSSKRISVVRLNTLADCARLQTQTAGCSERRILRETRVTEE